MAVVAAATVVGKLTFVDRGSCDVIEHKCSVNIVDVLQYLVKVDVFFKTDALHNNKYSNNYKIDFLQKDSQFCNQQTICCATKQHYSYFQSKNGNQDVRQR